MTRTALGRTRSRRWIAAALACAPIGPAAAQDRAPRVRFETELGSFTVEVFPALAPLTAANFLSLVDAREYDGASFYRVVTLRNQPRDSVRIQVIQGGLARRDSVARTGIAHETTRHTGIRHEDGAISMARGAPGTASSEFFICIGDQPDLDFGGRRNPDGQGFAAFGRVVDGMNVVRAIHRRGAPESQRLDPPILIRQVRRQP
jgi:peptidyl-prolyl cis-trans isomerase A (cyclophilin A)